MALKKGEQVSGHSAGKIPKEDTDKAALHCNILEKLQHLDPSRADHVQVLDGSQGNTTLQPLQTELSEAGNFEDAQAKNVLSDFSNFRNGVAAVAVTPTKLVANWERQARDMTSKEQELLKEVHKKIWATISAVDTNVATALKRNLEVSAAAIAQV